MTDTKSSTAHGGIGFAGILTIVFIVLKLTKVINWSWVWVLSPLWIEAALIVTILLVAVFIAVLAALWKDA